MTDRLTSYVELQACSSFSFLEGASNPEDLAKEAARLGYSALALADREGVYGAPRFDRACREQGIRPILGARVSLPQGDVTLLVESRQGYQNLCRLLTDIKFRVEKGTGRTSFEEMEEYSAGLVCITGGRTTALGRAWMRDPSEGRNLLDCLESIWKGRLYLEIQRHFSREQEGLNQQIIDLAKRRRLSLLATNGVCYARRRGRFLHDILTCIHHRTRLDQAGKLLNVNGERYVKPPATMRRLFGDCPQAVKNTVRLAERLDFTLEDLGYRFPDYPVPSGETMQSYLRQMTEQGARERYRPFHEKARRQIEHELDMIGKLGLAGYFLIVWDIAEYCRKCGILSQGRGSAANSAVCYSLGITAVDPVGMELLFERFLSEERGEWPDIDLDLPSGEQREQVIQYVYERYGRRGAAMTANVITYRGRSAAREVGKVFGFPQKTLDRLSKMLRAVDWSSSEGDRLLRERCKEAGLSPEIGEVRQFLELWKEIQNLPRHLGQHSGGMVICRGRLDQVVPIENARMADRTVVQWDKDDCASLGIIKVDLLGLGMMAAIQDCLKLIRASGKEIDLAHLPADDPEVYELLQKADTVGVFQVESRAQMATLPRLKPTCFYDLVVEVAIIRPGPIVGEMVHPYLRRRAGLEPVTYPHPALEPVLKRTLGVPLFQEQLLRIAMETAGFTGGEAEELRRALGFKRPDEAMKKVEKKLRRGLQENGISEETAETIVRYITSFALYGFPESHAASFALLAYASAYFKTHHTAEFYTALLNNQPMGFYHPATLVKDAQHRGQRVRPIDVRKSDVLCTIEADGSIRLGLQYVKGLRSQKMESLVEERAKTPFESIEDLQHRVRLNRSELSTLAQVGALNSFGMRRRQALWQAERAVRTAGPLLDTLPAVAEPSPLREMDPMERVASDYSGTNLTIGPHPMAIQRPFLKEKGIVSASFLKNLPHGKRVRVAGAVIVRQRPMTAKGFLFLSLEDETGISNIIVRPQMFEKERLLLMSRPFLVIDGTLQNENSVVSVRAQKVRSLDFSSVEVGSHNFH